MNTAFQSRVVRAHRLLVDQYHHEIQPYIKLLSELEMSMPLTFVRGEGGTLAKLDQYNWPQWAKHKHKQLHATIDMIRIGYETKLAEVLNQSTHHVQTLDTLQNERNLFSA